MKVTITHSIDLEEVPEKAAELLLPAEEKLSNAMRWLNALSRDLCRDDISAEMASMSLSRLRVALRESDQVLGEVASILSGVVEYEKKQRSSDEAAEDNIDDALKEIHKEKQNEPTLPF